MQAERCFPFLVFGLFWLVTHKLGWPALRPSLPRSIARRLATRVRNFTYIVIIGVVAIFVQVALRSSLNGPDCGGHPLFSEPLFPAQSVFTARTLIVGRSLNALAWKSFLPSSIKPWQLGDWAIARVERRLWGVPWSRFVLLTNGFFWRGEPYFIDGHFPDGVLTRFLPIIEAGSCARSMPLVDADLEFRVLKERQPSNGARIIGHVENLPSSLEYPARPTKRHYLVGLRVSLIGANGTLTTMTDQDGIYEFDGVQPADYKLKAEMSAETAYARLHRGEIRPHSTTEVNLIFGLKSLN